MPMSLEETMLGAQTRVENLRKSLDSLNIHPTYYVGLEGGVNMIGDIGYLFGTAYISSSTGE
jgi:non-canonical (house-cleaning) NTP pyrophosphatase